MKEEYFKVFIWDTFVRAALQWLFVQVPFLNFPILKKIIEHYAILYTDKLYEFISLFIEVSAIKLKNKEKQDLFIETSIKLKIISQRAGYESDDYKIAYQKAHDDFSQLTRFDIARKL